MADRLFRIRAWFSTRGGQTVAWLLVGGIAAWFALPAFSIAYTEGFQAEIVINAHALEAGDLRLADTLYPFNGRFFLLTRLGTSLAMLGLQHLGIPTGLAAFRLIGIASLILLLGVLLTLLWRVYRVGPLLGLLCCLLFPPVFETAYLPNDDMPSAALGCLALLLFWTRPTILRTAIAGLLLGVAALLRLDAVLVAPAFAILLVSEVPDWPGRIVRAVIAGALVIAVPVVVYRLCGLSFLETFTAVDRALQLWARPNQALHNDVRTILLGVTAIGGLAWLLGVVSFARSRRWRDLCLAVAVPPLYAAGYRSQLIEARYLLPVSPFILLAMAEGLRSIPALRGGWRTGVAAAMLAGFAIWIVPPPSLLKPPLIGDDEGPRFMLGRAWNPWPSLWWQDRVRAGQAAAQVQIERVITTPDPVIVTGYWTADRLVTLSLLERDFILQPETPGPCRGIAETFRRGSVVVLQIRTHVPFVPDHSELLTWQQAGLACLRAARPATGRVLLVNSGALDSPAAAFDAPGVVFSPSHDGPPPLAPHLVSVLSGYSVAELAVDQVAAGLDAPLTAEQRQAATDTLARRAELLR